MSLKKKNPLNNVKIELKFLNFISEFLVKNRFSEICCANTNLADKCLSMAAESHVTVECVVSL
jgi:hypothetical protein